MPRNLCKSNGDVAGTAKKCHEITMELKPQKKDEEIQEEKEATEKLKRFTTQKMARGFTLFEEALLVFKVQDPNVKWYMKVETAIQNTILCYCVIYNEKKKELLPRHQWVIYFKRVDRVESS